VKLESKVIMKEHGLSHILILIFLLGICFFPMNSFAQEKDSMLIFDNIHDISTNQMCSSDNLKKPLRIIGEVLTIAKIIIPIVIIALGVLDFFKVMTSTKVEDVNKAIRSLFMRIVSGIVIFFVPMLIHFLFTLIDDWNDYSSDYSECTKCLYDPKSCKEVSNEED